jgi:hypothetical protein
VGRWGGWDRMRAETATGARRWALEEFGLAELGDERRTARLVAMATRAAVMPGGRVSGVFLDPAERQGAYDFLESPHFSVEPMVDAISRACAERCRDEPFVFVPVDGTSLGLVDRARLKDFGSVGNYKQDGRGLKVLDAIAVDPSGIPIGVAALRWWARPTTRPQRRHPWSASRKVHEKETQYWLDAVDQVMAAFTSHAPDTRVWFQVDREGDSRSILRHLNATGQWFTVRSRSNRRLRAAGGKRYVQDALRGRAIGEYALEVAAGPNRRARLARIAVRVASVILDLRNPWTKSRSRLPVNVVYVREVGTTPRGEPPLEWRLLTNRPVQTLDDAKLVVFGYSQRWRIEELHRAWKSGICNVEDTQLHASAQVKKWATLLAAVAIRVERLKHLSREKPNEPASIELSGSEIRALILLKRRFAKRTETISNDVPTIAQATLWIAELGGYTGKSSGGPPGATTIARGLERVLIATEVLLATQSSRKKR